jgi:hypothetical protein
MFSTLYLKGFERFEEETEAICSLLLVTLSFSSDFSLSVEVLETISYSNKILPFLLAFFEF